MKKYLLSLLFYYIITSVASQSISKYDLLITEVMFDPTPAVGLPEEEFLEIYNNSTQAIELNDIEIHIGTKYFRPDSFVIQPDSFYVFWDAEIPTLRNSGDSISIKFNNDIIHRVEYNPNFHVSDFKENGGWSIELIDISKPCINYGNWSSSLNHLGGTPGKKNSVEKKIETPTVKVESYFPVSENELLITFNVPIESLETNHNYQINYNDALIEIPTLDSINIDSLLIFDVSSCFTTNFNPIQIKYGLPHDPDSGDLIMSEILFNPDEQGSDFVEIFNSSNHPVDLSQLYFSSFDDNGQLESPNIISNDPLLILPNSYMVFTSNPSWLENHFPKSNNIYNAQLPSMNNDEGNIVICKKSAQIIDEVSYNEEWHYTELNDVENVSLEKIILKNPNNSSNWTSASSIHNYGTPGYENSNFYNPLNINDESFSLSYEVVTPNADGYKDQLIINYNFDIDGWTGKIDVLNYNGITIHSLTENTLFGISGSIIWNVLLDNNRLLKPGIYAIWINAYNTESQQKINKKITFYINGKLQ